MNTEDLFFLGSSKGHQTITWRQNWRPAHVNVYTFSTGPKGEILKPLTQTDYATDRHARMIKLMIMLFNGLYHYQKGIGYREPLV